MFRLFDRYVLREICAPFSISLLVFTAILIMNQVLILFEIIITNGIQLMDAVLLFLYLLPSILSLTVPMAILIGTLSGLSRMSADKEILAFKTLGTGPRRFFLPLSLFTLFGFVMTLLLSLYLAPYAYQKWMRLLSNSSLSDIQLRIKPRVFNNFHSGLLLYYQGLSPEKKWKNIFVYSSESEEESLAIFAEEGRLSVFPKQKKAFLELSNGTIHSQSLSAPGRYNILSFEHYQKEMEFERFLPSVVKGRELKQKNIVELLAGIKRIKKELLDLSPLIKESPKYGNTVHRLKKHRVEIHKRIALSCACFVFSFLGFLFGASSKRGGKTNAFAFSLAAVLLYYVLMTGGVQLAMDTNLHPFLGVWGANILFSLVGIFYFLKQEKNFWFRSPFRDSKH